VVRRVGIVAGLVFVVVVGGCRNPWPSGTQPLVRAQDTLAPALGLTLWEEVEGREPVPCPTADEYMLTVPEYVARSLRTTDLFRRVSLEPGDDDWRARVVLRRTHERAVVRDVRLQLEDRSGQVLFDERLDRGAAPDGGHDPVPDLVRELFARAQERGLFTRTAR